MRKHILKIFILLSFLLVGCFSNTGGNNDNLPIVPTNIIIQEESLELIVGENKQIIITVEPSNAQYELIWSANNDCVVVTDGLITAMKAGSALITVSCKDTDISKTFPVTVVNPTYKITFELNDGVVEGELPETYVKGEGLAELPTITKEGYLFDGWYLQDQLITSIDENQSGDLHIIAKWIEIPTNYDLVLEVIDLIQALPVIVTYNDYDRVYNALEKYNSLTNDEKELVTCYDVLNEKVNTLTEIENDVNTITYVLGEDIFTSKEELFTRFFGDFYQFIVNQGGLEYLETKKVETLEKFLNVASDYNAGRGSMRHIGDIVGSYMLTRDVNGILANQPTNTFFGYCYNHDLYQDLLPFFIRFFAYWRLDEKYANTSNYGADTFAESWAPTVDIAKFFYYDENTTYVKSERMLDCFLNISNVLYGTLPTNLSDTVELPYDIVLRGYKFEGWYDNPEFTGTPITNIVNEGKKVILYAKWSEDLEQKELEAVEMVKIYIYNLTTEPANVNRTTVGYVREMYNALSNDSKMLVDNYDVFLQIEEEVGILLEEPIVVEVMFEIYRDFESLKDEFLADFNRITESNVSDFNEFVKNRYGLMSEVGLFFKNKAMFIKWAFIIEGFVANECARGLNIQSNRILNNEGGDLEYVSKAIGYFFEKTDASSDGETNLNFADEDIISSILAEQESIAVTFKVIQQLPNISIQGYTFDGYYSVSDNTKVETVEEDMPLNLVIKFK